MVNLAFDFTGDGWPDVLQMSGNAGNGTGYLYVNPKGQSRLWAKYITIQPVGNEETLFKDIDGDGRPDLIHAGMNRLRYSTFDPKKWDPANPTGHVDHARRLGAGTVGRQHRPRSGRCRHQRRRPHRFPERVRLVGAAAAGHERHLEDAPDGVRPLGRVAGRRGRRGDLRLRRQRRRPH